MSYSKLLNRSLSTVTNLAKYSSIRIPSLLSTPVLTSIGSNAMRIASRATNPASVQSLRHIPELVGGFAAGGVLYGIYGLTGGFLDSNGSDVTLGYDHYPSNNPCEDRIITETPIPGLVVASVADGHGGPFVSDVIKMEMKGLVKRLFSNIQEYSGEKLRQYMGERAIALYQELDNLVYNMVLSLWEKDSSVLMTGACLVSSFIYNNECVIANAGDCRAVLGKQVKRGEETEYIPVALSNDHNIREEAELVKMKAAHPKERDLVKYYDNKPVYIKGILQPSRCIGDFVLKSKEFINSIPLLSRFKSFNPPYITSTPEIQSFHIEEEDAFVVLASDGVWDELSNEEVIHVIGDSLNKGNSIETAANTVVEACLLHAAKRNELTLKQLKQLHSGQRRRFHDDMSVVIVKLHRN